MLRRVLAGMVLTGAVLTPVLSAVPAQAVVTQPEGIQFSCERVIMPLPTVEGFGCVPPIVGRFVNVVIAEPATGRSFFCPEAIARIPGSVQGFGCTPRS